MQIEILRIGPSQKESKMRTDSKAGNGHSAVVSRFTQGEETTRAIMKLYRGLSSEYCSIFVGNWYRIYTLFLSSVQTTHRTIANSLLLLYEQEGVSLYLSEKNVWAAAKVCLIVRRGSGGNESREPISIKGKYCVHFVPQNSS